MQVDLIANCTICRKRIDRTEDCWRGETWGTNVVHVLCLAVILIDGDAPSVSDAEMADMVNAAADDLCTEMCENSEHGSPAIGEG